MFAALQRQQIEIAIGNFFLLQIIICVQALPNAFNLLAYLDATLDISRLKVRCICQKSYKNSTCCLKRHIAFYMTAFTFFIYYLYIYEINRLTYPHLVDVSLHVISLAMHTTTQPH